MQKLPEDIERKCYSAAVLVGLYSASRLDGGWEKHNSSEHVLVSIHITPEMKRFIEKVLCKRPDVNQASLETELFSSLASAGLSETVDAIMRDKELLGMITSEAKKHIEETP